MANAKFFRYVCIWSRSRSEGQKFWYERKGLVTRNIHVEYENPSFHDSIVMVKVKAFVIDGRTDG